MSSESLLQQRTLKSYLERIKVKAKYTQESAIKTIDNLEKFCNHKFKTTSDQVIKELLSLNQEQQTFDFLQHWINWNVEKQRSPGTIRLYFSHLKNYLHYRGIKLDPQDIRNELSFPKSLQEEMHPLSIEEVRNILSIAKFEKRCMYLAQLSSGMRIGEIIQLRRKDLDISKERIVVRIPASITKLKRSRITFFSKEVSKMILHRLRKLNDDDLIWATNPDPKLAEANEITILRRYLEKIGLDLKYENGRNKITTHSFRAYFITKMSRHDANFAKKLAGQKGYLLQYDRISEEEKLELYLKYEPDLLIDSTEKDKILLEQQKIENHNLKNEIEIIKNEIPKLIEQAMQNAKKNLTKENWTIITQ